MTIDISKKLFVLLLVIVVVILAGFCLLVYKNIKSVEYEFDLLYLKESDIKYTRVDNIQCFGESIINGNKLYSCIVARRIK